MLGYLKPKKLSEKHENYIAEAFDGRTQIASGALFFAKGDVDTKHYLIECKATQKPYYIIKRKILDKITSEALKVCKIPLLAIRVDEQDFIMYREWDFKENPATTETLCRLKESAKVDFRVVDFSKTDEYNVIIDYDKGEAIWCICPLNYFLETY